MKAVVIGALGLLAGCNSLLGIHDLGPDDAAVVPDAPGDPCVGACECRVDGDCADPYSVCVDAVTSRTCECSAGYARTADTACAWSGVVTSPAFDGDGWTLGAPFVLEPTYNSPTLTDPGAATADLATACQTRARFGVSQTVTMPRAERSEALVAEVAVSTSQPLFDRPLNGGVQMGRSFYDGVLQPSFGPSMFRRCLGAGSYAPPASTGLGAPEPIGVAFEPTFCDGSTGSKALVDHVGIQPASAGECPRVGEVLNGDAASDGGWTFRASTADDRAGFAPGVGEQGSRGVELAIAQRCNSATATVPLSVPLVGPGGAYALSVYHSGTPGLRIRLDGSQLPLSGGGQPAIDRYCVPAPEHGLVGTLMAALSGGNGLCADFVFERGVIDSVSLAPEPACGTNPAVTDGGFESGLSLMGTYEYGASTARVVVDPAAHGGTRVLQLGVDQVCDDGYYSTSVVAPAAVPGQGPAVKFWYRVGAGSARFGSIGTFTPVRDNQWHQGLACLDPARPERAQGVYWELYQSGNGMQSCSVALAHESAVVDDLEVTTDPLCPAMN